MSPEQLKGNEADPRSDIFAFGAVLHEMLTGRRAFDADSQAELVAAILERHPPPLSVSQPLAPLALDRLVNTCLAKNPDDRWQSAHDIALELRALRHGSAALPADGTACRTHPPDLRAVGVCTRRGPSSPSPSRASSGHWRRQLLPRCSPTRFLWSC